MAAASRSIDPSEMFFLDLYQASIHSFTQVLKGRFTKALSESSLQDETSIRLIFKDTMDKTRALMHQYFSFTLVTKKYRGNIDACLLLAYDQLIKERAKTKGEMKEKEHPFNRSLIEGFLPLDIEKWHALHRLSLVEPHWMTQLEGRVKKMTEGAEAQLEEVSHEFITDMEEKIEKRLEVREGLKAVSSTIMAHVVSAFQEEEPLEGEMILTYRLQKREERLFRFQRNVGGVKFIGSYVVIDLFCRPVIEGESLSDQLFIEEVAGEGVFEGALEGQFEKPMRKRRIRRGFVPMQEALQPMHLTLDRKKIKRGDLGKASWECVIKVVDLAQRRVFVKTMTLSYIFKERTLSIFKGDVCLLTCPIDRAR